MPPPLPDELLEEIFLRLPPDEPASLVRASLASKEWLQLLTGPAFGTLYRDFHGAPPVLGFFSSSDSVEEAKPDPLFVSTKFRPCIPDHDEDGSSWCSGFDPWDCRHGRLVLGDTDRDASPTALVVLDPMTGCWWKLSLRGEPEGYLSYAAAVHCDVAGCDHRSCHEGPFRVVVVGIGILPPGTGVHYVAYAHVSMPVTGESCRLRCEWSSSCPCIDIGFLAYIHPMPPVLIQDTLYFMFVYDDADRGIGILKYDLRSNSLSMIDGPLLETNIVHSTMLVGMQDGSLGFAQLDGLTLNLWSRRIQSDGVGLWTECRVIDLKEVLPIQNPDETSGTLLGSVEGRDIILVSTDLGIYQISLKSLEWKKIWKSDESFSALVPYMSFYDPSTRERGGPTW